jgi:RNA-directed DNA polymerase
MGLWNWLKRRLARKPLTRDVSRLESSAADLNTVEEIVDTSGGPLKPAHQRRALRDPRLLPKPKSKRIGFLGANKRKKVMEANEAKRFFAETMRTHDCHVRDLLADEEQLARHGLPIWRTEQEVAEALGLSRSRLRFFSIHRARERACHYVTFAVPKRQGGERLIMAPKRELKILQRKLLSMLVSRLPISPQAHGFTRGRSVRSNAELHRGKRVLLKLDLADFFPTVHVGRIRGLLIALGYGYAVAQTLAVLMTESKRQRVDVEGQIYYVPISSRHCVQGAPTSPGLCNAVLVRLDRRLYGLARKHGFTYTRYADDLTFSGDDREAVHKLRAAAGHIVREEGFAINTSKTRVCPRSARQVVTGVVVNEVVGLSRQKRRLLRAAIHRLSRETDHFQRQTLLAKLQGHLAYLHMLNPPQADRLRQRLLSVLPTWHGKGLDFSSGLPHEW